MRVSAELPGRMDIAEFDYHLPPELIAQQPARPRDASRLLILNRASGNTEHRVFRDLPAYLRGDDVVVLNDTQVIRARLWGRRQPGGGAAEVLLLDKRGEDVWEALVSPGRRLQAGRQIIFGGGQLRAEVLARTPSGGRLLRLQSEEGVEAALERLGELPLPPYIHGMVEERDYQTVYAQMRGATAAPTAGLHFTPEMLAAVRSRVRAVATVTLHIGVSTFRPVHTARVEDHQMHPERFVISEETACLVSEAVARGDRIVAVGTSTARTLEAGADEKGRLRSGAGETDLFITPGYRFRAVGALLTNFHLARSTLLLLVCALAGRDLVMHAYKEAIARRYRFLSFGDAMLII